MSHPRVLYHGLGLYVTFRGSISQSGYYVVSIVVFIDRMAVSIEQVLSAITLTLNQPRSELNLLLR